MISKILYGLGVFAMMLIVMNMAFNVMAEHEYKPSHQIQGGYDGK